MAKIPYDERVNDSGYDYKVNKEHDDHRSENTACNYRTELNCPAAEDCNHSVCKEFCEYNAYCIHKF